MLPGDGVNTPWRSAGSGSIIATETHHDDSSVPTIIMKHNEQTQTIQNDMTRLVEDARALVAATADLAEEGVSEVRQRLAATLDDGRSSGA